MSTEDFVVTDDIIIAEELDCQNKGEHGCFQGQKGRAR